MLEIITKIEFDGNKARSKLLTMSDNLIIREKIKCRVKVPYIFLNKDEYPINKERDSDSLLENLTVKQSIKLNSEGSATGLDIFFNDTKVCSANCS